MARGWESKSVEEQQAEAGQPAAPDDSRKPQLTPEEQGRERERQGLALARKRVLQQLEAAADPRYAELLRRSLAELDARIARLDKG